jgi:hypothetical protein
VRYRLRTLLLIVAGSAPPIYAVCEGWKVGCLVQIVVVWSCLVAAPLMIMGSFSRWTTSEDARDRAIAAPGAIAIIGYLGSILLSMIIIGFHQRWFLP